MIQYCACAPFCCQRGRWRQSESFTKISIQKRQPKLAHIWIHIYSLKSQSLMHALHRSVRRTRLLLSRRGLLPLEVVAVREMRIGNQVDDPFRQKSSRLMCLSCTGIVK